MKPHQQRVIDEKAELDEKLSKLKAFIGGTIYSSLSQDEQERLSLQESLMQKYSDVLGQRIEAF